MGEMEKGVKFSVGAYGSPGCVKPKIIGRSVRRSLGHGGNPSRSSDGLLRRCVPADEHTGLSLRRRLADCGNPRRTLDGSPRRCAPRDDRDGSIDFSRNVSVFVPAPRNDNKQAAVRAERSPRSAPVGASGHLSQISWCRTVHGTPIKPPTFHARHRYSYASTSSRRSARSGWSGRIDRARAFARDRPSRRLG